MRRLLLAIVVVLGLAPLWAQAAESAEPPAFVRQLEEVVRHEPTQGGGIGAQLAERATQVPFLAVATIIFLLAIGHTFLALPITRLAHRIQHAHEAAVRQRLGAAGETVRAADLTSFKATMVHFLGEVEAIFGIWAVVLLATMFGFYGRASVESYLTGVNFTEPLFVVVIMALAATRPVLRFAECSLSAVARLGRETPAAWWLTLMVAAPLLGSLITEPGAMTIAAMLLARKFYHLRPSPRFAYATLGLLFVNISVGGVLTNFAAPPVLMVAHKWDLTSTEMLFHFGDKALLAIVLSSLSYFAVFRSELRQLASRVVDHDADGLGDLQTAQRPIPLFVTLTHLGFMAWTVVFAHTPPLFIGGFLFFLAFQQATPHHQHQINLRGPILVGFFLAGLVIHGGLQGWWLAPILSGLAKWPLFIGATVLTSFNDNAAITFLASQVEGLGANLKYAVLAGAVTGGGLTVIANAPNPAGQALLSRFFGEGISPLKLLLGALLPTFIVALCMMLPPEPNLERVFSHQPNPAREPVMPGGPDGAPGTRHPGASQQNGH